MSELKAIIWDKYFTNYFDDLNSKYFSERKCSVSGNEVRGCLWSGSALPHQQVCWLLPAQDNTALSLAETNCSRAPDWHAQHLGLVRIDSYILNILCPTPLSSKPLGVGRNNNSWIQMVLMWSEHLSQHCVRFLEKMIHNFWRYSMFCFLSHSRYLLIGNFHEFCIKSEVYIRNNVRNTLDKD